MNRFAALAPVTCLFIALASVAQQPAAVPENVFRFELALVDKLRENRDFDLALSLLKRLEKLSPERGPDLNFSSAQIRVEQSRTEPDMNQREKQRKLAKADLLKMLAGNVRTDIAPEAKLLLAQVDMQLAQSQLSQVLPLVKQPPSPQSKAEREKVRASLADAGNKLSVAVEDYQKSMGDVSGKSAAAIARQAAIDRVRVELAENEYNQARTFSAQREADDRAKLVKKASVAFEKISGEEDTRSSTWIARAWLGLLYRENGEPQKARLSLRPLLVDTRPVTNQAKRLARYFNMQVIKFDGFDPTEKSTKSPDVVVEELGTAWLRDYAARFGSTPEASGVRMLMVDSIIGQVSKLPKSPLNEKTKQDRLGQVRRLLRDVERNDNEFADDARRMKIKILMEQGAFSRKVEELKTFDDCFVRAQYEVQQGEEDAAKLTDPKASKAAIDKRRDVAIVSLNQALKIDEAAKGAAKALPDEVNRAKQTLTYFLLEANRGEEAIALGEDFARNQPNASQAPVIAQMALQAYGQSLVGQMRSVQEMQAKKAMGGGEVTDEKLAAAKKLPGETRGKYLAFATYVTERWPSEDVGQISRYQAAMLKLQESDFTQALELLKAVSPESRLKPMAEFQSAMIHYQLEQKENDPAQRAKALQLLAGIPEPADPADVPVVENFVKAKLRLASELYTQKKYQDLGKLFTVIDAQAGKLPPEALQAGGTKDRLDSMRLYTAYGLANEAMTGKKPADAVKVLSPIVANAEKDEMMKKDQPLAQALLKTALKASIQIADNNEAQAVIAAIQVLGGDPTRDVLEATLEQMSQAKSLKEEGVENARKLLEPLLGAIKPDQLKENRSARLLAASWVALVVDEKKDKKYFLKAEELLKPRAEKLLADAQALAQDRDGQVTALAYLRLLRQKAGTAAELAPARKLVDEAMAKNGWAAKNVDVRIESLELSGEEGKYGVVASEAKKLVDLLEKRAESDNYFRDKYVEAYYHMVYGYFMYGKEKMEPTQISRSAALITELEKRNFYASVPPAIKEKFSKLLESQPVLKAQYDKAKTKV
ncbi:MAG: hypothetical protein ACKO9Z_15775 [Planctomycetota bacterium]